MTFTLRDDETDERMAELHEQFSVTRYAWIYGSTITARLLRARLSIPEPSGTYRRDRALLDHMALDTWRMRTIRTTATGRIVNASGRTIGRTFDIVLPFTGTYSATSGTAVSESTPTAGAPVIPPTGAFTYAP